MDKNRQAIIHMQEGKFEKAAELFNEIIEENPNDPIGYINFGNLLIDINELERSERFFLKAIELDEDSATAYYGLGNLYFEQSKYQQAQESYQKAMEKGLEDSDVFFMLGLALYNQEQFRLALPYLLRASEKSPEDVDYLFQYGLALAQTNVLEESKIVFEKVLNLFKEHEDAHYNLGVIAAYEEKYEKALTHFNYALEAEPEHYLAANGKKQVEKLLKQD